MAPFTTPKLLYISANEAQLRIRNVYCIGRNYRDHATELGNEVPLRPMIFTKPTHALAPCASELTLPPGKTNIHHELEIVLFMHRNYAEGLSLAELIGGVGLGLDLTDRDTQSELKQKGYPWTLSKGFRNSAIITNFYQVEDWDELITTPFSLRKNDVEVQRGRASDMLFNMPHLLAYIAENFGLGTGDVVYTGTPAGVASVQSGDTVNLYFGDELWGSVSFR